MAVARQLDPEEGKWGGWPLESRRLEILPRIAGQAAGGGLESENGVWACEYSGTASAHNPQTHGTISPRCISHTSPFFITRITQGGSQIINSQTGEEGAAVVLSTSIQKPFYPSNNQFSAIPQQFYT